MLKQKGQQKNTEAPTPARKQDARSRARCNNRRPVQYKRGVSGIDVSAQIRAERAPLLHREKSGNAKDTKKKKEETGKRGPRTEGTRWSPQCDSKVKPKHGKSARGVQPGIVGQNSCGFLVIEQGNEDGKMEKGRKKRKIPVGRSTLIVRDENLVGYSGGLSGRAPRK